MHSRVSPVKENMPIWLVMWVQEPGVPFAFRAWCSSSRIDLILSDMVVRLSRLKGERGRRWGRRGRRWRRRQRKRGRRRTEGN